MAYGDGSTRTTITMTPAEFARVKRLAGKRRRNISRTMREAVFLLEQTPNEVLDWVSEVAFEHDTTPGRMVAQLLADAYCTYHARVEAGEQYPFPDPQTLARECDEAGKPVPVDRAYLKRRTDSKRQELRRQAEQD